MLRRQRAAERLHQEAADAATPDAALQCYLLANSEWPQTGQHLMGAAFVCRQLGERARALRLCEAAAALATLEAQAVGRSALREQQRLGAAPEAVRAMAAEAGALLREELAASGRVLEEATPD